MKVTSADHVATAFLAGTGVLTGALYSRLPEQIPTHFNLRGVADAWMPRDIGAWLLPATALGVWLLLRFGARILPRDWKERTEASPTGVVGALVVGLLAALQATVLYAAIVKPPAVATALGIILGTFWVGLGLVMPRLRRNPWIGVRTTWTLSSDETWARTHRVAGYTFVVAGLLALVAVVAGFAPGALVVLVASALIPVVFSYVVARQLPPS